MEVQVGVNPDTGAVADIRTTCSEAQAVSYGGVVGSPVYVTATSLDGGGFRSFTGIAGSGALAQFAGVPSSVPGNLTTLDCGPGLVTLGIHIEAFMYDDSTTQQIM